MSVWVHKSPTVLTKSALSRAVFRYIPKELHKYVKLPPDAFEKAKNDGKEELEWMLTNSDNMLRMYGSGEELAENLRIYIGFSSDGWIEYDPIEPYNSLMSEFRTSKDECFFQKSHGVIVLQHLFFLSVHSVKDPSLKYPGISHAILSIILKSIAARNAGNLEFVDRNDFEKLFEKLKNELFANRDFWKQPQYVPNSKLSAMSKSDALIMITEDFKKLIPVWKTEYSQLEPLIQNFVEDNYPNNIETVHFTFSRLIFMISLLECTVSTYPHLFLPYDRVKNPNHPIVVRIFQEDDDNIFLIKSEFLNALTLVNPNIKRYEDTNDKLLTLKYESIYTEYGDHSKKIHYLPVPIRRTKHAAVPIQTPSGDYCILAVDALFEILNRLIFCHRIFQKFQESTWPILSAHLAELAEFFSANERSPFFVTLKKVESIEESITNSLKIYEKIPANSVRNAKKDGFTVQNLKNELVNLGVTLLFPEIQDYAEEVYSEVLESKTQEFLRTCDLFDAVEKCLLICIFKRFPNLQLFLHTQHNCHLLPHFHCNHCSGVPQSKKFQGTTWKDFSYDGHSYSYLKDIKGMVLPDGENSTLQTNFSFFELGNRIVSGCRYFLLGKEDHYALVSLESNESIANAVMNLDAFQKFHPEKNIYIRTIPVVKEKRDETRRVFAEEVLDLIPVVLRQQNTPIQENDERLNNYRNSWKMPKYSVKTISLTEFWYILEEFDVDKTRITIVPDSNYEYALYEMVTDLEDGCLKIKSPCGNWVIRKEQAAFKIFESVICEINLSTDQSPDHTNCIETFRKDILSTIRQFLEYDEGAYIELKKVEITISILRNHSSFKKSTKKYAPFHKLQTMEIDHLVRMVEFLTYMREQKFNHYLRENMEMLLKKEHQPVWKCFEWFLNACLEEFKRLENDIFDVEKVIREEISFRIPTDEKELKSMKPIDYSIADVLRSQSREDDNVDRKKKKKRVSKKKTEVKILPEFPDDTQKTLVSEEALEVDMNQSKNCAKCLRTSEMCNEAKKELKSTQNRLEKYEKKAKRTEEVEIQMREMEAEIKKMKKEMRERDLKAEKKEKENEELRMKVSKLEANEIRMRLNEKNLEINRNEMQVQITDLTFELEDKNQKNEELQGQVIQLTRKEKSLNNKISKKENQVKKLQGTNRELLIRISHLEQSNSNLLEEITTISREGLGSPDDPKNRLLRLETILESYSHGYQLKHSKEMVEKLKSCSDSVKIHQIADYERDQYDGKLMRYVHEVEMNIQKIKTTKDCTLITPLPEQPSFSNRFMDLYWKIINNQPITSTDLEVRDSECFICYEEMIYSQKTMICKECKKQTHWKCASKWLKTHRSCPHCRREMLDPNEFPDLS
ncbi:unnamed protein product [Caenorhabditis nigoni]